MFTFDGLLMSSWSDEENADGAADADTHRRAGGGVEALSASCNAGNDARSTLEGSPMLSCSDEAVLDESLLSLRLSLVRRLTWIVCASKDFLLLPLLSPARSNDPSR